MASIDKKTNGRWKARYRSPDGGSRAKTFRTKSEAQAFLTEKEHSKNIRAYVEERAGRATFQFFAEKWLAAQTFEPSTREAVASRMRVHIYPFLGKLELRDLRPSTVQGWLRGRQGACAPSYVRLLLAHVNSVLGAAVDDGLIAKNPVRRALSGLLQLCRRRSSPGPRSPSPRLSTRCQSDIGLSPS